MRKPLALVALALTAGLTLAAPLALRGEYEAGGLKDVVVARLTTALGVPVEAGRCRLRPLQGFVLEDVVAKPRLTGGSAELHVEALILETRLSTLLFGDTFEIESLRLVAPSLKLQEPEVKPPPVTPPKPPVQERPTPSAARKTPPPAPVEEEPRVEDGLAFLVKEVIVDDASLTLTRDGGGEVVTIEGLSLHLYDLQSDPSARSLAQGLSAEGELSLRSADLEVGHLDEAMGRVVLEQGTLRVEGLVFTSELGRFETLFETNFLRTPFVTRIEVHADPFDLHSLVDSPDSGAFGGASFELSARGRGTDPEGLKGKGVLKMKEGLLPWFPLLGELEVALKRLSLYELEYTAVEARFDLIDGRLVFEPFRIQSEGMWVDVGGSVSLGGDLALDLLLHADKTRVDGGGIPSHIRHALEVEGGHWSVPAKVTGTADAPRVSARIEVLVSRLSERGQVVDEAALRRDLQAIFARGGT